MSLIHLFRRCDQKCVFCSYPAEAGPEEGEGLRDWLREISRMKDGLVQVSGGEPLLAGVGDLVKLLSFCARTGRRAELQTNGVRIGGLARADLARLARAVASSGGCFNVNFPAHNAALDGKMTRTPGAFARRVRAVRALISLDAEVRLTFVLSRRNYRGARAFVSFAAKEFPGLARIQFSYIKGLGRASGGGHLPSYVRAAPYLRSALDLAVRKGLKCEVDHIPPCFLGAHAEKHVDLAKMRAGSPGPHLAEKSRVPSCRGCRIERLCPGPRKDHMAARPELIVKKL